MQRAAIRAEHALQHERCEEIRIIQTRHAESDRGQRIRERGVALDDRALERLEMRAARCAGIVFGAMLSKRARTAASVFC